MDFIVLFLLFVVATLNRILSPHQEQGTLPWAFGFLLFANVFHLLTLVNCVWMFGWVFGVIVFLCFFLQLFFMCYLWPFVIPDLIKFHKNMDVLQAKGQVSVIDFQGVLKPNMDVYAMFSASVPLLLILTIINFFVGDYKSMIDYYEYNLEGSAFWLILIVSAIIGNVLRSMVLKKFTVRRS